MHYIVFIEKLIQGVVNHYTYFGTLTILHIFCSGVETLIIAHESPSLSINYLTLPLCIFYPADFFQPAG